MKHALLVAAFFAVLWSVAAGCSSPTASNLSVAQLAARPELYAGKRVTLEGFYFQTFETNVFCDSLQVQSGTTDYLVPKEPLVWVEGSLPEAIHKRLYTETRTGFAAAYYGKLRLTARFDYGGKYGSLGGFRYQLAISTIEPQVEFLPWTPPTGSSQQS